MYFEILQCSPYQYDLVLPKHQTKSHGTFYHHLFQITKSSLEAVNCFLGVLWFPFIKLALQRAGHRFLWESLLPPNSSRGYKRVNSPSK